MKANDQAGRHESTGNPAAIDLPVEDPRADAALFVSVG
jgi:hypothetical protein